MNHRLHPQSILLRLCRRLVARQCHHWHQREGRPSQDYENSMVFQFPKNTTYGYSRPQSDRKVNNELFYFGGMTVLHVASPNGNFSCKWIIIRLQRISTFFHRKIGLSPAMSTCQRLFYYCNKTLVVQFMHGKSTLIIIYIYLLVGGLEHLDYFSIQLGIS